VHSPQEQQEQQQAVLAVAPQAELAVADQQAVAMTALAVVVVAMDQRMLEGIQVTEAAEEVRVAPEPLRVDHHSMAVAVAVVVIQGRLAPPCSVVTAAQQVGLREPPLAVAEGELDRVVPPVRVPMAELRFILGVER